MALTLPHRTLLRRAAVSAALGALLVPAAGVAPATAAKRKPLPTVSTVLPMKLSVGDTLTIRGRNFLRGRGRNTVVFQRTGAKAIFVKADIGTAKLIKVKIPSRLTPFLMVKDGAPVATRFRIRVLSARFGKRFTKDSGSPVISAAAAGTGSPAPAGSPGAAPVSAPADGDCDGDGLSNGADADDDNDLLSDGTELPLGLDACKADSDGDTVTDGYEYQSARDLNDDEYQAPNQYLPYPGKRPYPNPLDRDANVDYDGDSLSLGDEFALWKAFDNSRDLSALLYSDGQQCSLSIRRASGRRTCTLTAAEYRSPGSGTRHRQAEFLAWAASAGYASISYDDVTYYDIRDFDRSGGPLLATAAGNYARSETEYYDLDQNGVLTDDERDEDGDGLINFDESTGRTTSGWWAARYPAEEPYYVEYRDTAIADADTDGDGVRDGADDQDHDDIPNVAELSRNAASGRPFDDPRNPPPVPNPSPVAGQVNPYNPCLPFTGSRTCNTHPPFEGAWAPFGDSKNYYVFN